MAEQKIVSLWWYHFNMNGVRTMFVLKAVETKQQYRICDNQDTQGRLQTRTVIPKDKIDKLLTDHGLDMFSTTANDILFKCLLTEYYTAKRNDYQKRIADINDMLQSISRM